MARPKTLIRFNSRTVYKGCVDSSRAHSINFDNDAFTSGIFQAMKFIPTEKRYYRGSQNVYRARFTWHK